MLKYDLITEPWLPVITLEGESKKIGLREALLQAHKLAEIRDPLPIIEFSLYRLLGALLHDILRPKSWVDIDDLIKAGSFDAEKIYAYFNEWSTRFDLFQAKTPFLQTACMDGEKKPLSGMLPMIPSGTNVVHFHHAGESDFMLGPAAAARLLCTISPFMTAGGAGLSPSINGSPPWYVLIHGKSLFETLVLNLLVIPTRYQLDMGVPAWRRDTPVQNKEYNVTGYLEAMTWQPRRVQLIPQEQAGVCSMDSSETPITINQMYFTAGATSRVSWTDPNVPYRITDKGIFPYRPQEDREIWRDMGPLTFLTEGIETNTKSRYERPALIAQYVQLIEHDVITKDDPLQVTAYSMRSDGKMKIFEWQRESLSLPVGLIISIEKGSNAQIAMVQADKVAYALKIAIKHAYPREGASNKAAFDRRIDEITHLYWVNLDSPYRTLLQQLAQVKPGATYQEECSRLLSTWKNNVLRFGHEAFKEGCGDLDVDGKALQRQIQAQSLFEKSMWKAFSTEKNSAKKLNSLKEEHDVHTNDD